MTVLLNSLFVFNISITCSRKLLWILNYFEIQLEIVITK